MPQIENILGKIHYRLLEPIAEGGMGSVYKAEQLGAGQFRKTVAIKLILEELSFFDEFQENFIGEARLVSDLIHTNIVQTYHLGEVDDTYFIVMEYVNGLALADFIQIHRDRQIPIPVDLAVFIASRVCRGLAYAHAKTDSQGIPLGIVHRDINPRNIMISREGDIKITDFGIAKARHFMHCQEGEEVVGKDGYHSPEQVRREITDSRADIFATGIVLSEMLLGENVFLGEDSEQSQRRILELELPPWTRLRPDVDARLETILHRMLARDREQRHSSAAILLDELERYLYSDGYGPTNEKLSLYLKSLAPAPV